MATSSYPLQHIFLPHVRTGPYAVGRIITIGPMRCYFLLTLLKSLRTALIGVSLILDRLYLVLFFQRLDCNFTGTL